MMKPWILVTWLGLVGFAFAVGYVKGGADNEAGHVAGDLAEQRQKAARQSEILTAEVTARDFAIAQEDSARAEPIQSPVCLSRSRVLRLKAYDAKP